MSKSVLQRSVQERATDSFFADHLASAGELRVCRGLSCELHGAEELQAKASARGPTRHSYCLGHCDRSPTLLDPEGRIYCGDAARDYANRGGTRYAHPEVDLPSIRCLAREPIVTQRIGKEDCSEFRIAEQRGVYAALQAALNANRSSVLNAVEESGEQGRGGAGYPTGKKWRLCAERQEETKYVVANGDEGDPGSYIDRALLECDPHSVIEGMLLCGFAIGATFGFIYIRSEYPLALERVSQAVNEARHANILGPNVLGHDFSFDIRVVAGKGSYVCGEETALLNAIEGRRGEVRLRPPYPVEEGLFGQPTIVNNIESIVNIPWIVRRGASTYRKFGTPTSPGTKVFCLNGGFAKAGLIEAEFGISLREVIACGGSPKEMETGLAAVALGGPMGSILLPDEWDITIDYPTMVKAGVRLGHAGLVAIPNDTQWSELLTHWLRFMSEESCGKCVPCSAGSARALSLAEAVNSGNGATRAIRELYDLLDLIQKSSLCGFGTALPGPVRQLLTLVEARESEREAAAR